MNPIDTLMRSANPVQDPQADIDGETIRTLLALTIARSTDVDTKEMTRPNEAAKPSNRWWAAVAAFAAVVIAVGAAVLFVSNSTEGLPATSVEQPVPTVEEPDPDLQHLSPSIQGFVKAYEEAFNSGDSAAFVALFAPGAFRIKPPFPSAVQVPIESLAFEMVNLHSQRTTVSLEECVAAPSGVLCFTVRSGPVHEAFGLRSLTTRDTYLLDEEGRVREIRMIFGSNHDSRESQFRQWMESEHPEVYARMVPLTDMGSPELFAYQDAPLVLEWAPIWADLGRPTP